MAIRVLGSALIIVWLLLVVIGKGGFIHLLLLNGMALWIIDLVSIYRARMTETESS